MKLHAAFPKGKRLLVATRDGEYIEGKFLHTDPKRKEMVLDVAGARRGVRLRKVRFASILQPACRERVTA